MNNILLTGIPRSGTTLCCSLLNEINGVVALHEPLTSEMFDQCSCDEAVGRIRDWLLNARQQALTSGVSVSKQKDGLIPTNPVEKLTDTRLREENVTLGQVHVGNDLPEDFTQIVKHNALFTALLPELADQFSVFGIVRNPLSVMISWQTVNLPVRDGRIPMGERFDSHLKSELDGQPDKLQRQLIVLRWFFTRLSALGVGRVIRYEDVVASNGEKLVTLLGLSAYKEVELTPQSQGKALEAELLNQLAFRLIESSDMYAAFYSPDEVARQYELLRV